MLAKLKTWINHNQATAAAIAAVVALTVWMFGCASTTIDPVNGQEVTRDQLTASYEAWSAANDAALQSWKAKREAELASLQADERGKLASFEAALSDLDRKDETKRAVLEIVQQHALPALGGPWGAIAGGLLGLGLVADNRRKDGVIRGQRLSPLAGDQGGNDGGG